MCVNEAVGTGYETKVDFILKIKTKQTKFIDLFVHTFICDVKDIYYVTNIVMH